MSQFLGKRVLVTAGAGGIGLAIAARFMADGAHVGIIDINAQAVDGWRAVHPDGYSTVGDVSDPGTIDAWIDGWLERFGGVDVLVNNAGASGPVAAIEDITIDDWRRCLSIALDSHFLTARRVMPVMKAQGSGSVIAISSTGGLFGLGLRTPYASAKWAIIGMVKSLAIEGGPYGVRANVVCPGTVSGPRIETVLRLEAEKRGIGPADVERAYLSGQSIERFAQPEEVADLCTFLASDGASMISGQAIAVDGHTETFHIS